MGNSNDTSSNRNSTSYPVQEKPQTMKGKWCFYAGRKALICQEGDCKRCGVYMAWRDNR